MKYYRICRKILGEEKFNELMDKLLNDIIKRFGKEINIEQFVKVLEINIDAIIMLAISKRCPNKRDRILKELNVSILYLVRNTISDFEQWGSEYIEIISKK